MNDGNLIPVSQRTSSELRAMCSKGGKASGKARREKREMRERLKILLEKPLKDGKATDIDKIKNLSKDTIQSSNLTAGDAAALALIQKAIKGDVKAYEAIRDQIGEKPVEEHKVAVIVDEDKALEEWIKKLKECKDLKEELKDD